jgi:hypothetical protein
MRRVIAAMTISLVAAIGVSAQQPSVLGRLIPSGQAGLLPGTPRSAFGAIEGTAFSSTNAAMADMLMRLRDARLGSIVDSQMTNQSGLFAFRTVDPGSYVVELLGPDEHTVLAASQLLTVSAGDSISTIVKLPFELAPLAGLLGTSAPAAAVIASSAAASGVMAATVVGADTCALVSGPR